jgi:hypothetical protein
LNPSLLSRALSVTLTAITGGVVTLDAQGGTPLKLRTTVAFQGVEGRIDHFAFDAAGERLFVCALGNNTVEVIDLRKAKRIHSFTGLGAPQGVAYAPELNRIFVANDNGGVLKIYDSKSFQPLGELQFKDDADNVRYDEASKKVYVGFGNGGIAIVDALDGKEVGSIKLSAHPEAFALEKNGKRIFANVPNARQVAVIDRDAEQRIKQQVKMPEGYLIEFGGQYKNLQEARARLAIVVPAALALIFILIFLAFGSLRQALLVYTGIPLAVTGGVLALWLRGMPFSITAAVGFIALSGVAVLNGLVMITYFNQLREEGRPIRESVIEGSLTRLRPVLMTALVASLGFVPMAIATGTGAEVQRPLSTVVIGGILSSTFLTLIVLPVLYSWFEREEKSSAAVLEEVEETKIELAPSSL